MGTLIGHYSDASDDWFDVVGYFSGTQAKAPIEKRRQKSAVTMAATTATSKQHHRQRRPTERRVDRYKCNCKTEGKTRAQKVAATEAMSR